MEDHAGTTQARDGPTFATVSNDYDVGKDYKNNK